MQKSRSFFQTKLKRTLEFLQRFSSRNFLNAVFVYCDGLLQIECVFFLSSVVCSLVHNRLLLAEITKKNSIIFYCLSAWNFNRNISTRCTCHFPWKLCLYGLQGYMIPTDSPQSEYRSQARNAGFLPFKNKDLGRLKTPKKTMGFFKSHFLSFFWEIDPRCSPYFRASKMGSFGLFFHPISCFFYPIFWSSAAFFYSIFCSFFVLFFVLFLFFWIDFFIYYRRIFLHKLKSFFCEI